ncbi:hypothetical protein EN848_33490, partial [bacterium M00.F.Ca.ET.205.01.1.1]
SYPLPAVPRARLDVALQTFRDGIKASAPWTRRSSRRRRWTRLRSIQQPRRKPARRRPTHRKPMPGQHRPKTRLPAPSGRRSPSRRRHRPQLSPLVPRLARRPNRRPHRW